MLNVGGGDNWLQRRLGRGHAGDDARVDNPGDGHYCHRGVGQSAHTLHNCRGKAQHNQGHTRPQILGPGKAHTLCLVVSVRSCPVTDDDDDGGATAHVGLHCTRHSMVARACNSPLVLIVVGMGLCNCVQAGDTLEAHHSCSGKCRPGTGVPAGTTGLISWS